jgi:hypothetical protein
VVLLANPMPAADACLAPKSVTVFPLEFGLRWLVGARDRAKRQEATPPHAIVGASDRVKRPPLRMRVGSVSRWYDDLRRTWCISRVMGLVLPRECRTLTPAPFLRVYGVHLRVCTCIRCTVYGEGTLQIGHQIPSRARSAVRCWAAVGVVLPLGSDSGNHRSRFRTACMRLLSSLSCGHARAIHTYLSHTTI